MRVLPANWHVPIQQKNALWIFGSVLAAACVLPFFIPRIPQPGSYHQFADSRPFAGIPNAGDVLSNLLFLPVGIAGLYFVFRSPTGSAGAWSGSCHRFWYGVFFTAIVLTTAGSSWYHLAPDHFRLLWDRIPIAMACGSLLICIVTERAGSGFARWIAPPWFLFVMASPVYWYWSELSGAGDLRFWGLAQFFPALAIPLLTILFPPQFTLGKYYFFAIGLYAVAKGLEALDGWILIATGMVSGHSLKHIASAGAAAMLWMMLRARSAAGPRP